ncbi:MAG: hypothetical protein JJE53_02445 [Candidatus Pacebacteria bacterium]|nr:hypothetical protein [Candidatus Paceibacterota bacterium]
MTSRTKLKRAEDKLKELQDWVNKYFAAIPYKVAVRINSDRRPEYYIADVIDVPLEIVLLAGEAIQNLRSALDHLAYNAFKFNSNNQTKEGINIYFPIEDSQEKYIQQKTRKTEGIPSEVIDKFDSFKPYKEGNITLWKLNKLNNIDKHRLLIAVGSSFGSLNIAPTIWETMRSVVPEKMPQIEKILPALFILPADKLLPLKKDDVLFLDLPDKVPNSAIQFQFHIAFNESGVVEGDEITEVLKNMYEEVLRIYNEVEPLIK